MMRSRYFVDLARGAIFLRARKGSLDWHWFRARIQPRMGTLRCFPCKGCVDSYGENGQSCIAKLIHIEYFVYQLSGTRGGYDMLFLLALLALLAIAAVTAVAVWASQRSDAFRPIVIDESLRPVLQRARSTTRFRALVSLGVSFLTFVAVWTMNQYVPQSYGLTLMLAPGIAAIVGLVAFALFPPVTAESPTRRRQASLVPRRLWSYGPRWAYVLPTVGAAAVVLFAILAGLSSRPSQDGNYRAIGFELTGTLSESSPYPGWYYGVPVIAMTLCLLAATLLALWRISSAPRPNLESLGEADRLLRVFSARAVMKLSSGALFAYLGGVLLFAGMTTHSAATIWNGVTFDAIQPAATLGVTEIVLGLAFVVLGGSLLALAVIDVVKVPKFRPSTERAVRSASA